LKDKDMASKDVVESILQECAKLSETTLFPLYQGGDEEGCVLQKDGTVRTPKGWKEAWAELIAGGWQGLSIPQEYGGQGLPLSLNILKTELMSEANWSFQMYPGLTLGAANTLFLHGSEEQKKMCLPKFASGQWLGTMCLTEPQCGTDLGLVKTKAEPTQTSGLYKITGTKIFISSGDHDFGDNIIHIVLAKLPNAPEGTKGISLFLVPKYMPTADGGLEKKRNVNCIGLENKMGIHGGSTCQLAFDGALGWLIGQPNQGLKYMFTFMNTARLGTALQGIAHAEVSYQNSLSYAKERIAMRSLTGAKAKDKPADPIIVHPDVRRMLLFQKSIVEAGRAFVLELSTMADEMYVAKTQEERDRLDSELGLFTPIAKGCLTELGLEACNLGMQVWGGHGYIKENGMEQIARDARIATLYEGTTGVQALDLIGRKVLLNKFSLLNKFTKKIGKTASPYLLSSGTQGSQARTLWWYSKQWKLNAVLIGAKAAKDREMVGSSSVDFMMYSGYITLGYYWFRMANVARKAIAEGKDTDGFYLAKVQTAEFYFERVLPRAEGHAKMMLAPPQSIMQMKQEHMQF
jgi:alkylation response protein AidB-like acyl-CoA dehydrogenase